MAGFGVGDGSIKGRHMIIDGTKNISLHWGKTGVVSLVFLITIEECFSDIFMNGIPRRYLSLGNTSSIVLNYEVQHPYQAAPGLWPRELSHMIVFPNHLVDLVLPIGVRSKDLNSKQPNGLSFK